MSKDTAVLAAIVGLGGTALGISIGVEMGQKITERAYQPEASKVEEEARRAFIRSMAKNTPVSKQEAPVFYAKIRDEACREMTNYDPLTYRIILDEIVADCMQQR